MPGSVASLVHVNIEEDEVADAAFTRRLQEEYDNEGASESDLSGDSDGDGDGAFGHIDIDDFAVPAVPAEQPELFPERFELDSVTLDCGDVKIGDVVELKDTSSISIMGRRYGDFLLVKHIVEDIGTVKVTLRGFRLRRCTNLAPLFDAKLNDLVMMLEVARYDNRPHHVQGITEVSTTEVIGKRICKFTNLTYELMGLKTSSIFIPGRIARTGDSQAISDFLFHNSPLYCRWVNITINEPNGKPYGGEVRRLYKREKEEYEHMSKSAPVKGPPKDDQFDDEGWAFIENPHKILRRSGSVESLDDDYDPRRRTIPSRPAKYKFADIFCGAGGASYGAVEAGLTVQYGVEIDKNVIESYHYNHPNSKPLAMDAHNFPAKASGNRKKYGVDQVHFSTTCKYFAHCHTRDGKDDQMNYETIFTVGPILKVLKPPYATAEQAPGMSLLRKHRNSFRKFLNMIMDAGYNVRYQVIDLSSYGLPQRRRRLLFNMSKIGYPLAPFPNPTHGLRGSGLKRFVSVADALEKLERVPAGHRHNDPLHQPEAMRWYDKTPYDPHTSFLKGLITTSGGKNWHYTGKRKYTAREYSFLQTFPIDAYFHGSPTSAIQAIGNAYPPIAASQHMLTCAQTREAFDHGYIGAEEEIRDLWETLNTKGINVTNAAQFRYLNRLEKNAARSDYVPPSIWARSTIIEPRAAAQNRRAEVLNSRLRRQREVLAEAEFAEDKGEIIWVFEDDD
ncbi:S-adenosyl-L-methionine-dependent methyltransferase [Massarina eburnea CBS 473.64]|uniref:DNA (cytosine-5-)-methyltransferase n=1 Tax=Massarina eburnea CBS 473.64 TaxID=1395130 RepID=A0A6A6RQA2_9PLEO|nr:S-adenosyl-L-methionine-dependent methyltransferase [Massarina eburnea CBS 473.64]